MSAAKLRAEAKNDMLKKKRDEKAAKHGANVGSNAALWKKAFDSDQPLAVDDVAQWYASWVNHGMQGKEAKEAAFESCKNYKHRIGGLGRCREGWVFKTGSLGLGYYKDGVPEQTAINLHKLLWPPEHLAPIAICLDDVVGHKKIIGDPLKAAMDDQVERKAPKVVKTRKQNKMDPGRLRLRRLWST